MVRAATGTCHHCGASARRQRLFCSPLCQRRDRLGLPVDRQGCAVCDGQIPDSKRNDAVYCSTECANVAATARRYGMTTRELADMRHAQGSACAVCRHANVRLFVDHNHVTGAVRGLLCGNCNSGIGLLQDNPRVLERALTYLQSVGHYGGDDDAVEHIGQTVSSAEELGLTA
ncbi:endonuclease VII domain-containing protein [Streptomyces diastaticus]|uniref:endonuclease VII domain-containing protein n=1 Tax=Streptomyces diastaticus TaxID=1956 RepID=UPI00379A0F65